MRRIASRKAAGLGTGSRSRAQRGFTLVELIISITLLSTLALVVVPMLRMPMAAYLEAGTRADVTGQLDMVQGRLRADLARALPNSVRLRSVGARRLLEFLEVRAHGRHRAGLSAGIPVCPLFCALPGNNDSLETTCTERCFTSLGPLTGDAPVPGNDYVVVNPLGPGVPGGDPYFGGAAPVAGGIKTRLTALAAAPGGARLDLTPHSFPALAASRRFFVVAGPVSYECDPATGRLTRYDGYAITALQPAAFGAAPSALVADSVAACSFGYTSTGARGGLVTLSMRFTRNAAAGATESTELVLSAPVLEP